MQIDQLLDDVAQVLNLWEVGRLGTTRIDLHMAIPAAMLKLRASYSQFRLSKIKGHGTSNTPGPQPSDLHPKP